MKKLIARLFGTTKTNTAPKLQARLSLDAMEPRYAPASLALNPGTLRGFDPQPEPPGRTAGIIAINPGEANGIISIDRVGLIIAGG